MIVTQLSYGASVLDGIALASEPAETRDLTERWPECPVPIIQRKWEFMKLLDLYRTRQPLKVLEVGTGYGGTLYYWLKEAAPESIVVAVDSYSKNEWYGSDKDNRKLYDEWVSQSKVGMLTVVAGNCQDPEILAQVNQQGPYDWIFIDAGHKTWETLLDWNNYKEMVAPGGLMAFHDIISYYEDEITKEVLCDVPSAWEQIRAEGYLTQELIAMPRKEWYTSNGHNDWSGIGIVYFP